MAEVVLDTISRKVDSSILLWATNRRQVQAPDDLAVHTQSELVAS